MSREVYIRGSGSFLPGEPVPFENIGEVLGELKNAPERIRKWMKTTESVLKELLSVEYFHYAYDPEKMEFTEDNISMSVKAAEKALDAAGLGPEDIDLICYGSPHQDQMPTPSVRIQERLGIEMCDEISVHANCTSAYKAMYLAHQLISSSKNRYALVVSSNIASSELIADYYNQKKADKDSLFLRWFLCDGAGALVLSSEPKKDTQGKPLKNYKITNTYIESIGGKRPSLMFNNRPAYWINPLKEYEQGMHHLKQKFRNSLSTDLFQGEDGSIFIQGLKRMLDEKPVPPEKIRYMQVNLPAKHIADSVREECAGLGIQESAYYTKLDNLGYSGPPMAFICLDKIIREEEILRGEYIVSFVTEVSKFMQAGYSVIYE